MDRNLRRNGLLQNLRMVHNLQAYGILCKVGRLLALSLQEDVVSFQTMGLSYNYYLGGAAGNGRDQYSAVLEEDSRDWYNLRPL